MNSLELAKQMLEEAGYKVTPPEEKFTPYKGQLVEVSDRDDLWHIREFSHISGFCYACADNGLIGNTYTKLWQCCRPLSNKYIKQFKPWSERGDYTGPANVLFDSGEIGVFDPMSIAEQPHNTSNFGGKPIAFEPLEK